MSQQDVLNKIQSERETWDGLLAQLDEPSMLLPGVGGTEWTVKDIIVHVEAYERWMAVMMGSDIEPLPPMPSEVNGADTDERNAWFYTSFRDLPLDEVQARAQEAYKALLERIRAADDDTMNQLVVLTRDERLAPARPAHTYPFPPQPMWKWIAEQSYEHYQQHYDDMEAWIEETQKG